MRSGAEKGFDHQQKRNMTIPLVVAGERIKRKEERRGAKDIYDAAATLSSSFSPSRMGLIYFTASLFTVKTVVILDLSALLLFFRVAVSSLS